MNSGTRETTTPKHGVLIVHDHPLVRRGLCEVIAAQPDLEVCGQAGDVQEAIHKMESSHPDVMVIDLAIKEDRGSNSCRAEKLPEWIATA